MAVTLSIYVRLQLYLIFNINYFFKSVKKESELCWCNRM